METFSRFSGNRSYMESWIGSPLSIKNRWSASTGISTSSCRSKTPGTFFLLKCFLTPCIVGLKYCRQFTRWLMFLMVSILSCHNSCLVLTVQLVLPSQSIEQLILSPCVFLSPSQICQSYFLSAIFSAFFCRQLYAQYINICVTVTKTK